MKVVRLILECSWGACAPNSKEDASNEDSGEDAENSQDMDVSSDNESDEGGNYQTKVDIRM